MRIGIVAIVSLFPVAFIWTRIVDACLGTSPAAAAAAATAITNEVNGISAASSSIWTPRAITLEALGMVWLRDSGAAPGRMRSSAAEATDQLLKASDGTSGLTPAHGSDINNAGTTRIGSIWFTSRTTLVVLRYLQGLGHVGVDQQIAWKLTEGRRSCSAAVSQEPFSLQHRGEP